MTVRWLTAFIDRPASSFDESTGFWLAVTGTTLSARRGAHEQFATLVPSLGDAYLRVQRVDSGRGGCHLDLYVDDIPAMTDRAAGLGAHVAQTLDDVTILRSPGGLPFCIVAHRGECERPAPATLDTPDTRAIADQLCIDAPPDLYDDECAFWRTLTGWEHRSALLPEFSYLVRPEPMPLRLLFQRQAAATPGDTVHAHLDFACDDRDAAAVAHETLGARILARYEYWTTLADPSGLPYCLTRRSPDTGLLSAPSSRAAEDDVG